jgi:hypothetical protein
MYREIAPVIAAQDLLARGIRDADVCTSVRTTWNLDMIDGRAAVAAAHVLQRHPRSTRAAEPAAD